MAGGDLRVLQRRRNEKYDSSLPHLRHSPRHFSCIPWCHFPRVRFSGDATQSPRQNAGLSRSVAIHSVRFTFGGQI